MDGDFSAGFWSDRGWDSDLGLGEDSAGGSKRGLRRDLDADRGSDRERDPRRDLSHDLLQDSSTGNDCDLRCVSRGSARTRSEIAEPIPVMSPPPDRPAG